MVSVAVPSRPGLATGVGRFLRKSLAIAGMEIRKLRHDPTELLTRAIQPALWLVVFGQVLSRLRGMPTGDFSYLEYMTPGILAQSVLFIAIFYGISVIWERDLGIVHKFLVSPTPRSALVAGKALSAGLRALSQAAIIYLLAFLLGVRVNWNPLAVAQLLLVVLLGAALFASFSLAVACLVKTRERFMGIGQVLTMPLFFASNAIYSTEIMPPWLRAVSHVNPLTYQVDALRTLMLVGARSTFGLGCDVLVLASVTVFWIAVTARLYPGLAR